MYRCLRCGGTYDSNELTRTLPVSYTHLDVYKRQPPFPHYPTPRTNPPKTALSLALHYHTLLPCQRELDCDKATSYYKLQHFVILSTLISVSYTHLGILLSSPT